MKLKTLTIHNIASIEDAMIDFDGNLLGGQDLFLICGPTGSGKTTILDAICLALFNNTPRIHNTSDPSSVINAFAEEKEKEMNKVKNVLHLVRKHSPEAKVTLTFEGIDGRECTAIWEVRRKIRSSKNKTDEKRYDKESLEEKLNRGVVKEWSFIDGDGIVHTKECGKRIQEAIQMTFEQFCKTTMLAQGDFTKFLKSSGDEKAQILEKLVGTEKYAEVGKIINRRANDKKNEVAVLAKELENFQFLSEEEKVGKNQEIKRLTDAIKGIGEQKGAVEKKLRWIADVAKAEAEEKRKLEEMEGAAKVLETDEVKREVRTVQLWDKTTDLREALTLQRECIEKQEENAKREESLKTRYHEGMMGLRWLQEHEKELMRNIAEHKEWIESQSRFATMYGNANVIITTHNNIVANEKYVTDNTPKLKELEERIEFLNEEKGKLAKDKETAEGEIRKLEEEIIAHKVALHNHGDETIDDESKRLAALRQSLDSTVIAMKMLSDAEKDLAEKHNATEQSEKEVRDLTAKEEENRDLLAKATEREEASRMRYDKMAKSIDDHAKLLRSSLKEGDDCPVCGHRIDRILSEESIIEALKPLEIELKEDAARLTAAKKAHDEAKVALSVIQKTLATATKSEVDAKMKVEAQNTELNERCETLGVECNEDLKEQLTMVRTRIEESESALEVRKKRIKEIRQEIDKTHAAIGKIREERVKKTESSLAHMQKEIESVVKEKGEKAGGIENAKEAIKTQGETLQGLLNPEWEPEPGGDFYESLREAAMKYEETLKQQDKLHNAADIVSNDITLIQGWRERIEHLFPTWTAADNRAGKENLGRFWNQLYVDCTQLAESIATIAEQLKKAKRAIGTFDESHPEINLDEVAGLLTVTGIDIHRMRNHTIALYNVHMQAEALYAEAVKRKNALQESPLEEGETPETLQEKMDAYTAKEQEYAQMIGSLRNELETDERNRMKMGLKKMHLEKLRAEYSEWELLNKYLGGNAEGKQFRNVAQSFILGDLLEKANEYLAAITGRYTLFCNPGTLTILLRDSYQGGEERPTNTLSGGESFIISLSLALGLSSMQSHGFEVDTLFIDEGFGTLSQEYIDPVLTALRRLYETYGRRVGFISHIESLKSSIPVIIEVKKISTSKSIVEVCTSVAP